MDNPTLSPADPAGESDPEFQTHEFRAMGSHMTALVQGAGAQAGAALAAVPGWFAGWEQQLSRFRDDSELSQLNRQAGQAVPVSPELWAVVQAALAAAAESEGLVTPAVLNALEAAGYDRSFDLLRAAPPPAAAAEAAPAPVPDWRAIRLDPRHRTVWVPRGVRLDFGGIAKGWAADRAAAELGRAGPALVDAGGDIAVSGPLADGSAWPIGVADPTADDGQVALLRLSSGGVATSGRDYRRWQHAGHEAHHIIDPRTGAPAVTDVLSATVVAPSAAQAEVAAKTVLILGSHAGLQWLDRRPALAGLVILEQGDMRPSHTFARYLWPG
ncbi:MAG TPA: FAD:protein FMN transferase [Chloroflexia bacterium]|nr:FAD:protein FMN transferase [Chloroflexia bacterium]